MDIKTILERGVENVIEKKSLEKDLKSGKKLRIKFGIDPTGSEIHLGHTVPLRKLRQFQELGHQIILIIGDFTAQIGDPSDRTQTRKPLTEKEVKANMKFYIQQAAKFLDIKKTEIHYNSQWYKKEGLKAILELAKSATIQQILKRGDFKKRLESDSNISVLETLYPLLQGYDSVKIKADVEIGGQDQLLNLLMGRRVQRHFKMPEQNIVTLRLIEGLDGKHKMSKSLENYIAVQEKPEQMFGKLMSVPDNLMPKYFEVLTDIEPSAKLSAREQKLLLAETIVAKCHSPVAAKKAKDDFIKTFSKKELPTNIPNLQLKTNNLQLMEILIKAGVKSKSEARRLILQNAVEINNRVKNNFREMIKIQGGAILKIGKKTFFKIKK